MIYAQLFKAFGKQDAVNVGVIGTGAYGTAVVTQGMYTPRMHILAIADIDREKARAVLAQAGVPGDGLAYCANLREAEEAVGMGKRVYTDNSAIIPLLSRIDVVCDSTGNPEAAAQNILAAINNKKHVAVVTKDCDVCVGPLLRRKAEAQGVVYTPVDGDQHGLLIQLYGWAKSIGLSVLCGGKATDGEFEYDQEKNTVTIKTDKVVKPPVKSSVVIDEAHLPYFRRIPEGKAAEYIAKRQEALRELPQPGAYDLCEMTVAANYTNLSPQVSTLLHAPMRISEIPSVYCELKDGGLLEGNEALDLVTVLRAPDEAGLGGGVFLVVRCDNAYSNHILATKGQISNHNRSATVIYRPYHLCGVETPMTLLVAGLLNLHTASDTYLPRYQLIKVAARDIKPGEVFEGDHGQQLTAEIVPYAPIHPGACAEAHLLMGNKAGVFIKKGSRITYDMVLEPRDSLLWALRREQDALFADS